MPPLRPLARLHPSTRFHLLAVNTRPAASLSAATAPSPSSTPAKLQPFHSSPATRSGGGGSHYEPPSGWLWGVPPGQKREKEGWETVWFWGFYGSLAVAVVGWAWKPDSSIETWALEEAKRRLQAEGTLPEDD